MDKDKQLPKCPECNGPLSSEVARGWCEGEWSDYYCHYCQQDFFKDQVAQDQSQDHAVQLDLENKTLRNDYPQSLRCHY